MKPHILVGLIAGAVGLVFGLVPGLFARLTEAVRNAQHLLVFGSPARPIRGTPTLHRPLGLAAVGAAILVLTATAYVLR